jgi:hypothetical protein
VDLASVRVDVSAETTTASPTEARYGPVFDAWSGERSSGIRSGSGAISPKSALTLAAYYAAINVLHRPGVPADQDLPQAKVAAAGTR